MNAIVDFLRPKPAPLMLQQIAFDKSVIHAAVQDVGRKLCESIGHDNAGDFDEFLNTESGRRLVRGVKDGLMHLLAKGIE